MRKYFINVMLILISLLIPKNIYAAVEKATREYGSITLNYYYDDYDFDGVRVKVYCVASMIDNNEYQLSSDFLNYQIEIKQLMIANEWIELKNIINNYIDKDNINEVMVQNIKDNKVIFNNLQPGLYFIKTDSVNKKDSILVFDSSLIGIPNMDEDGTKDYDIDIYSKIEEKDIEKDNPDTGDDISLYFYLFLGSFIGLILLIIVCKRYNSKR